MLERILKHKFSYEAKGITGNAVAFVLIMVGWVFFRSTSIAGALDYIAMMFSLSFENLKERGVTLVMVPIPMKNTVYPEFIPDSSIKRPKNTGFQRLRAFLDSHPEVAYVDAQEILVKAKREDQVYYKTDFHWNNVGAFYVAKDIVNLIGKQSNTNVVWNHPLKVKAKNNFSGGQNRFLAVFLPPLEEDMLIEKTWDDYTQVGSRDGKTNDNLLPKTVIFGNSFAEYWPNTGIDYYFTDLKWRFGGSLREHVENLPAGTKYFVWQSIETGLLYCFKDEWWPVELDEL